MKKKPKTKKPKTVVCPYCKQPAILVSGATVYPHRSDLMRLKFWKCSGSCDAYVGVHSGTENPKGPLADADTRFARKEAHGAFDKLWKHGGPMTRREAYKWLASKFRRPAVHIGWMDENDCEKVVEFVNEYWGENG